MEITPFYVSKLDDSFLNTGIQAFLEEGVHKADLVIERVYVNERHKLDCLIKERELTVFLEEEKISSPVEELAQV